MKHKLQTMWKHLPIRLLLIILVLVLPLNVISVWSVFRMSRQIQDQTRLNLEKLSEVYAATLSMQMQSADDYLYDLGQNDYETVVLRQQRNDVAYQNSRYRCHRKLQDQLIRETYICGYFMVMPECRDTLIELKSLQASCKEDLTTLLEDITSQTTGWKKVTLGEGEYLLRIINISDFYCGAILSLDTVYQEILQDSGFTTLEAGVTDTLTEQDGTDALSVASVCEYSPMYVQLSVQTSEINGKMSLWGKLLILVVVLLLLVIPVIYHQIRRLVLQPLDKLNEAHYQMEQGNRTYQIEEQAKTLEFQQAYHSFNHMINSIENLRTINMQKELEKKKLELNNLQLQIRPHFLLNTFNMMYMMCSRNELTEIRQLILYLSDYFRYLFRSGKDLELFSKEEDLIRKYVEVACLRYPDCLEVQYIIEPEIELVRIPPLLVHNFVENVVRHGLIEHQTVHVVLIGQYEDGFVEFQIMDDGKGMDEAAVEMINQEAWPLDTNTHLGIRNSLLRLRYFYTEEASIHVESAPGEGTAFTLRFPYQLDPEE